MVKLCLVRIQVVGLLFKLSCFMGLGHFFLILSLIFLPFGYPPPRTVKIPERSADRLIVQLIIFLRQRFVRAGLCSRCSQGLPASPERPGEQLCSGTGERGEAAFRHSGLNPRPQPPPLGTAGGTARSERPSCGFWVRTRGPGPGAVLPSRCSRRAPPSHTGSSHTQQPGRG